MPQTSPRPINSVPQAWGPDSRGLQGSCFESPRASRPDAVARPRIRFTSEQTALTLESQCLLQQTSKGGLIAGGTASDSRTGESGRAKVWSKGAGRHPRSPGQAGHVRSCAEPEGPRKEQSGVRELYAEAPKKAQGRQALLTTRPRKKEERRQSGYAPPTPRQIWGGGWHPRETRIRRKAAEVEGPQADGEGKRRWGHDRNARAAGTCLVRGLTSQVVPLVCVYTPGTGEGVRVAEMQRQTVVPAVGNRLCGPSPGGTTRPPVGALPPDPRPGPEPAQTRRAGHQREAAPRSPRWPQP